MNIVRLKGITWNHSRGITPLMATSQRFSELNPGVEIVWEKRSLQEFADYPLEKLTQSYDLLIIDHPWVGRAADLGVVLPLDDFLSDEYLSRQQQASVGQSFESYCFNKRQWALSIDAATPVASYRQDLFEKAQIEIPKTWNDLIHLAQEGKVLAPSIPIDLLMNFYAFCIAVGEIPFEKEDEIVSKEMGIDALNMMKELWSLLDSKVFDLNPILTAELMIQKDDYWYCPFAYGYSNYSRRGYGRKRLKYTNIISLDNGTPLQSTLGGTGLAVSTSSKYPKEALQYISWVCSEEIQCSLYADNGGQPGYRKAWLDAELNRVTKNFFVDTLKTLDNAFLRPRYSGYLHFQDKAGVHIQSYLKGEQEAIKTLDETNKIYRESKHI